MNRKRIEYTAGVLRDLGLAALIGGVGDAAVNRGAGRGTLDAIGIVIGLAVILAGVVVIGLDRRRRRV